MADLMFPDIAGRFQQGQQLGLAQRLQGQGEQRRNRLAELAGQAYGATGGQRDAFVQQAVATDPEAGFALGNSLQSSQDARTKDLVNRARLLDSAPDEYRPRLYASMLPDLQGMGIGDFPAEYDESVGQTARAIVQAYGAPDQSLAPRVVGDALVDSTGKVVYQAPHKNKHEFDSGRGVWIPHPDNVAGDPGPGRSTMEADIALANDLTAAGFPEAQIESFLASRGQRASAMSGGQTAPQQSGLAAIPVSGIGPKPSAPPAGYQWTSDGGLSPILGGPADPSVVNAISNARRPPSAAERRDAATRKTKYAQAQNVDRGLDRVTEALKGLSGGLMDTGPVDQYAQRFTKSGQELEAAVGGMQNSLLALTRVPGIGSQSDLEARIAMLQYPSLDKAPEVNARTIANLREFVTDLKAAYDTAVAEDEEVLSDQFRQAAPTDGASNEIDSLLDLYR